MLACMAQDVSSSGFIDTAAHVIAIVVIVLVPIVGITVFWLVHILPEKIAEKRHHPQKDAIKALCLLSLVFGGVLWPLAWLWAYSRPVFHKMAYGTDKHDDFYAIAGPAEETPKPQPLQQQSTEGNDSWKS
jgi:Na+/H+ antiporter NhaD/arsenite permease-like protein